MLEQFPGRPRSGRAGGAAAVPRSGTLTPPLLSTISLWKGATRKLRTGPAAGRNCEPDAVRSATRFRPPRGRASRFAARACSYRGRIPARGESSFGDFSDLDRFQSSGGVRHSYFARILIKKYFFKKYFLVFFLATCSATTNPVI